MNKHGHLSLKMDLILHSLYNSLYSHDVQSMPQSSAIRMITQAVHASKPIGSAAQCEQTSPPDEAATEHSPNSPSNNGSDSEHADTTNSDSEHADTTDPDDSDPEPAVTVPASIDSGSKHADTTDSDDSDSEHAARTPSMLSGCHISNRSMITGSSWDFRSAMTTWHQLILVGMSKE